MAPERIALRTNGLKSRLARYQAADALEAEHLRRMLDLCESIADPFSRDSFAPGHFTASAFIASPSGDELLLILHSKLGRWLQPGGHIDPSDPDVRAAALREVREEVGVVDLSLVGDGPLDLDIHDIPERKGEPRHAHFDVRFLFRAHTREFVAGSDAKAARWVPLRELNEQLSDRSVMRAVEKLARGARAWG